jgi:acyl-homoserine lactone acylase PvdQ
MIEPFKEQGSNGIGSGTTEHVAWTSTVSTADHCTFYQLILNPAARRSTSSTVYPWT